MFDIPDAVPDPVLDQHLEPPLATQRPGVRLAARLDALEVARATDFALVEVVAAWQRVASWAAAQAAAAAAELAGRDSMNPRWPVSATDARHSCVAADELAMRLACSRRAARLLVRDGLAFAGPLTWTGEALARGEIDAVKARMIADRLEGASMEVALAVQDAILGDAHACTPTQLGRTLTRALIEVDPADAALRHDRATTTRHVDRPRLLPDGMAGLWAVLPAEDAARIDMTLDTSARSARATGDPRTLDQLRADLLVDLATAPPSRHASPGTTTCAASTARLATPATGTTGTTGTRTGTSSGSGSGSGTPSSRALDALPRPRGPAAQIRVTVSASTLMGLDDQPAELDGYGAITAVQARALAAGGVWRRLVTDPLSGTVLDVGRTRYRPPADLAELVVARDRYCAAPGCSARAESCDLDHTVEFHRTAPDGNQGTTSAHNLGPLCRRHHQIKTDGGFRLSQPTPGTFEWTSPTGHQYRVRPGATPPPPATPNCTHRDTAPAGETVAHPDDPP
ncbi:DUF222 domain-containing protein [Cellulomonas sp. P22]|uniref:HNH endonuclease signature motif containing protein n=1 Tax=Cellulomonas sp. P22 TaxID=3373189 RepID=UPI00379C8FEE